MRTSNLVSAAVVLVMVISAFGVAIGNSQGAQNSVDSSGYRYTDSKSPSPSVAFNWVEIRPNGTDSFVYGDDDYGGPFPIGFNFTFYGNRYTAFNISTNGMITFGQSTWDRSPDSIPDTWSPNNYIAPYWDDLYVDNGEIVYQTIGSAPDRQLVVQFSNVTQYFYSDLMTFEIILYESRGDVWLQYLTMNGDTGSGATIGIENSGGTSGVEYGYYDSVLTDNLAVRFAIAPIYFGPSQVGYELPGNSVTFSVTLTNSQWIDDSFALTYTSALGWTVSLYDLGMNPLIDTDGDMIVDTGTVLANSTVTFYVTVSIPSVPASQVEVTALNASSYANSALFDLTYLSTVVMSAWFEPPHSDAGFDTDADGLYNYLLVNASVYVMAEGWFYLYGWLYTGGGAYLGMTSYTGYLTVGMHEIELRYFGWYLYNSGVNSPYRVDFDLYNWSMLLDEDTHMTGSSYQYSDFMLVPGALVPPFSDCGVDTDGDGLYDYLQVNVTLNINYDGRFVLTGQLEDSNWDWIENKANDSTMSSGSVTVRFRFDAWTLSKNGVEGVFHIWIGLQGEVDSALVSLGSQWYTTASYDLSMFERPPALLQPPYSDRTVDYDGDFLYDYLIIEVQVNVTVEDDYRVRGILTDWWGDTIDTVENNTHLTVGTHTVELWYPGWPIRYNGDSDNFDVDLLLFNGTMQLDDDQYTTAVYYYYWDFETAPAWFEAPYSDVGLDTNGDSLYDYIVVQVGVNVTMDGMYDITARLRDWTWSYIETVTNSTFLTAGLNTVELRFTGWLIRSNGWDGPFTVLLELYDHDGRLMDNDQFSTGSYLYTDFQTVPAQLGWPHEASAMDTDGDGLYEMILVNVTVEVTTAGDFFVWGALYDSSWYWTSEVGTWATLASGTQIVQLSFPSYLVYGHLRDGTYTVYIYLEDASRYSLDSSSVSTTFYYYDDFDPQPPRIYSGWTNSVPTIDGVFGTSEWAGATVIDLRAIDTMNELDGRLLVMNNGTDLFICYDVYGDRTMDNWDFSSIAFDTGNDNALTNGDEDMFYVRGWTGNPTTHYTYNTGTLSWSADCSPFDAMLPEHTNLKASAGFGTSSSYAFDHRIYEYSIPLSLIEATPGGLVGFLGASQWDNGIYDDQDSIGSSWPVDFVGTPRIAQYGEIMLAQTAVTPPPATTAHLAGTAGSAGWYVSAVSVTMTATGGLGGIARTEYTLDGGSWQDYTGPITISAQGSHTIQYRSVDNASQTESTKTLTVKIDTVDPTTASAVSGANVWLNSSDATSGLGSTRYRVDNGTWQTYTGMLTITGVGTHLLEFYSVDSAGNQETTKSVSVIVEAGDDGGGSTSGTVLIWAGMIIAAVVAALVIVLLLVRRKKGQMPTGMPPQMPGTYQVGPPPPPSQ